MTRLHWNDDDGVWYDYDIHARTQIESFYISNIVPLFAKCYENSSIPKRVYEYMKVWIDLSVCLLLSFSGLPTFQKQDVFSLSGGIPTSFVKSVQQWDGANAWPPMVHMVIEGFRTSGDPELAEISKTLAIRWLKSLYKLYANSSLMYEKYNVSIEDITAGSGGEYTVQVRVDSKSIPGAVRAFFCGSLAHLSRRVLV